MWKGAADSKKRKRLSKNDIKKELLESTIISETIESEELNREAEGVQDLEEAAKVIEKYEYIIKNEEARNHKHQVSSRQGFYKI